MNCCKVGVVAEKRDLSVTADADIHEYLVTRWLGDEDYPEMGVRKLADWFNRKVMREVYTDHGRNVTDVRVTSEYDALKSDDEVTKGEVVDDLATDGIDGAQLLDDFVSRSTMRRHLTNCLGVSKDTPETRATSDWEFDQIEHSKQHLEDNVEESIRSLANKGKLPGATDADVDVAIFLSCPECSTQVRLRTALDRQFICPDHLDSSALDSSELINSTD